jgi:hypothetical protein
MASNESHSDEKQDSKENVGDEAPQSLLSQREIRSIMKDFAIAYVEGRIKINFQTANEMLKRAQLEGKVLDFGTATQDEIDQKTGFKNTISICLGVIKATPDEVQKAICILFDDILILRNGDRIEGVFTQYGLENRIKEVEEGLDKVNNLVEEMIEYFTGLPPEKGASNNKSMF